MLKFLIMLALALALFNNATYAANINWDGHTDPNGDGVSWTDPFNWAGDVVPGPADNAVFPTPVGALTVVQGPGVPNPIRGIWIFNNANISLDLDLTISGVSELVRLFVGSTVTFKSGRTFDITVTGFNAIVFWRENAIVNVEAGATVNLTGQSGIGTRPTAPNATINNFGTMNFNGTTGIISNPSTTNMTIDNYGTMNFNTTGQSIQPNNATSLAITNHECATLNLGISKIRLWGSNPPVSSIVNNGLITFNGTGAAISITTGNIAINNGFYDYATTFNFAAGSGGTGVNNGLTFDLPATITVNALMSCTVGDIGIAASYDWYQDPGNTVLAGSNDATGFLTLTDLANAFPNFNTLYTCYGDQISLTVNNADGDCTPEPCFPGLVCPPDITINCDESTDPANTGQAIGSDDCTCNVTPPSIWINEFHYDNVSTDMGEFIEVAGPAGYDLTNCQLVLYNGANGNMYGGSPINLTGTIDNEGGNAGAVDFQFPTNGIQNGPDGIALICGGVVEEFISYEGSFTANNGPAAGLMSVNIGVSEPSNSPIGQSLQRQGTGSMGGDFSWTAPSTNSPGSLNTNQTVIALPGGGPLVVTFQDVSTQTPMGCSNVTYTITRTWTATDGCGMSTTCVQEIMVQDVTPPVFDCPADITINCDESTDLADTGMATATDNCAASGPPPAELVVTFNEVSTQGQGCSQYSYIIIRTWEATDACGNTAVCSQVITVQDLVPPTITCPPDIEVDCSDPTDPGFTGYATASGDNCASDDELAVTFMDSSSQTPDGCTNDSYIITRTWTASDPCGNTAQCVQTITVVDTQAPEMICPENVTIECDESTDPSNTGTPLAVDNCTTLGDLTVTFSDASTQTASGCGQYQYTITRTWTATDACGNASNCIQTIEVVDTTPPDIVCPANVTLDCTDSTDPDNAGMATSPGDNCSTAGEINISSTDVVSQANGACATRTITRTWVATDACGNSSSCVQTINVTDTTAPTVTCPPGEILTCNESLPNPISNAADFIAAGGTISDDCTTNLGDFTVFAVADDNEGTNCPGDARVVVRTYTIQDGCGNTSTCDQTFTYLESTVGPVITSVLPACYKYCASLNNPYESDITYVTDCNFGATVEITGPTVIGQENCPGTIYRYTYTVTDDCGRTTSATRDFIIGNEGPTIECAPFNLILECGNPNNQDYIDAHLAQVSANTSCELGYNITHFPSFFNLTACGSSTVVTFIATDDCGRTASCTTTIAIQDNTGPAITSTYVPDVCNEAVCGSDVNFWYAEWKDKVFDNLTAADDCFSPIFWSTNPASPFPNQNCPDESAETVVQFIATDQCGNTSYVEYSFYVVPAGGPEPGGAVLGLIETEESESVADVEVSLEGNGNMLYDVTEADGLYSFSGLDIDQNYTVTPYQNNNPLNGVSTFDIVLMAKHILEIDLLDSPYKMIAADINKSGTITTIDMVELRKLILFIDDEFANNTSWRFVEAAFVFPDPTNPFETLFPEIVDINGLSADEIHDFVGIKIGDLNGSAQANAEAEADDRTTTSDLVFAVSDEQLQAGQTYKVGFKASDFESIHGYQFSLNFATDQLEMVEVEAGALNNLSAANFGTALLERGVLTTSWNSQDAVTVPIGATVFSVSFTAKADGQLSELLNINSNYTVAEAYNKDLDLMGVDLRFDIDEVAGVNFELLQNTPNPFTQETVIGFNLPASTKATVNVLDISGKVVKVISGDFDKGYNQISLSAEGLETGLLYYQLITPTNTATKKMINIK